MSKLIVDASVLVDCFQRDSPFRQASAAFVERVALRRQLITMPAHGWFEVWCTLNRLSEIDRTYLAPEIGGVMQLPVELIHIDSAFIDRYGNVRIPYLKGSDHIYVVVAYLNDHELVTRDAKMRAVCEQLSVRVFAPSEYLERS